MEEKESTFYPGTVGRLMDDDLAHKKARAAIHLREQALASALSLGLANHNEVLKAAKAFEAYLKGE